MNFLRDVVAPAGRGDLARVEELVAGEPAWVHVIGSHGRTMLWEAAYRGRLAVVEYLVAFGADLEAPGCHLSRHGIEITPYCVAVVHGRAEVAATLLDAGAEVSVHTAAYLGRIDDLERMLTADPALLDAGSRQTELVKGLPGTGFRAVFDPDATPLAYARAAERPDVEAWLIERGAVAPVPTPETTDPRWPELVYLCRGDRGGNPDAVRAEIARTEDVDVVNYKGRTALHLAARSGFVGAVRELLRAGATVDATDPGGETPLFYAIRSPIKRRERTLEVVEILVAAGADPTRNNATGATARSIARRSARPDRDAILAALG